jgi:hypothetical protein
MNPFLRFRGRLQLHPPTWDYRLDSSRTTGFGPDQRPPAKNPDSQPQNPKVVPRQNPVPAMTPASKGEAKGWEISLTAGFGITKPLWTSKTLSGAAAPRSASHAEVDHKVEFDVQLPPLTALGHGNLTLSFGGEYDAPLDSTHKGKPSVTGTVELSGDDAIQLGKKSTLSPFIDLSIQDQKGQVSGIAKAGLELKLDVGKNMALKADVNVGVQKGLSGLDRKQDPSMVIPFESNGKFEIKF